jgi:hypothetical protein
MRHGVAELFLHATIGDRNCIVKHAGIREVLHGKTVQPFQRTRKLLVTLFALDANLAGTDDATGRN